MNKILTTIAHELSSIDSIKSVILYGSFARGEITSRSDIDMFIITSNNTKEQIEEKIISLESSVKRNIQPTIRTEKELEKTDSGLLQNIFQEGRILFLKEPFEIPSVLLLKQKPFLLYTFKLNNLSQKNKAKFNRQLYEQTIKKYKYKGLLQKTGGQKLSSGCIIIPYQGKPRIERFFKKFGINFELMKVWK